MTAPDLSRLRIDRDAEPEVKSGFRRNLIFLVVVVVVAAAAFLYFVGGRGTPVQAIVVSAPSAGGAASATTSVTANFSEIAFSFRVTPGLLGLGLAFAVVMGVLGGFFPARRAARLPVVQALRKV